MATGLFSGDVSALSSAYREMIAENVEPQNIVRALLDLLFECAEKIDRRSAMKNLQSQINQILQNDNEVPNLRLKFIDLMVCSCAKAQSKLELLKFKLSSLISTVLLSLLFSKLVANLNL